MNSSFIELKRRMRREAQERRASLTEAERAAKSRLICEEIFERHVLPLKAARSTLTLFTYIPFRTETDTLPLLEWSWLQGIDVVVPKVNPLTQQFELHGINGLGDLEAGAWGIREPKEGTPVVDDLTCIDVILVPGLAFDRLGGRLGYGGGYYDRFFEKLESVGKMKPLTLAPAFEVQLFDAVPMEEHDFRLDAVVTENSSFDRQRSSSI